MILRDFFKIKNWKALGIANPYDEDDDPATMEAVVSAKEAQDAFSAELDAWMNEETNAKDGKRKKRKNAAAKDTESERFPETPARNLFDKGIRTHAYPEYFDPKGVKSPTWDIRMIELLACGSFHLEYARPPCERARKHRRTNSEIAFFNDRDKQIFESRVDGSQLNYFCQQIQIAAKNESRR